MKPLHHRYDYDEAAQEYRRVEMTAKQAQAYHKAQALETLRRILPVGSTVTTVWLRRSPDYNGSPGHHIIRMFAVVDGAIWNITGYAARVGVGTYTRGDNLAVDYADHAVCSLARRVHGDERALKHYSA